MYRRAFTLVELLVVISIFALLMGIMLPALGRARAAARDLRSRSDLRQLITGYTAYQNDHNGDVMLGYPPNTFNGNTVTIKYEGMTFGPPVSQRYPWRLVPYVSGVWDVLHDHAAVPELPRSDEPASVAFGRAYMLSLYPAFGLNDVYVGGSAAGHGYIGTAPNQTPNVGQHVVFNNNDVRRTSELIVLGDSQVRNIYPQPDNPEEGYFRLTAPHANGEQWRAVGHDFQLITGSIMGIPQGRNGPDAGMSFFDGHVESLSPEELNDMRYWANNAATENYDYAP